ncbi:pathogenesis-related thaumatin-like protein 3.5 [Coffea arabica]|uniref:Pathogenesis-related thaumatin-like protein 3.5 n=1 Tax=Coffea arabica TaxID=13443 RepID=A0A6P6WEE2_COFAR
MALWRLCFVLLFSYLGADAKLFTFRNDCEVTIWPGILANAGKPQLANGGFRLLPHSAATIFAPTGWAGRFWARSQCTFDETGNGKCATGDCGGALRCNGAGGVPPATLAEFSLDNPKDFYDISLVDGFNIPISIVPSLTNCSGAECTADLNRQCRPELQVTSDGKVVACKSACLAFGKPEFCCAGSYSNPNTCKPSVYSKEFKAACPTAYSYAFDDPTSTFTCQGADYSIIFC